MNPAFISVIVPVYTVEAFLQECIDSILAQTFTDFELILVDDGSPDNCGAICDANAARDSRIRVIHQKNQGVTRARISMDKGAALGENVIFAVGNAPTALIRLRKLIDGGYRPKLIIGVPVGFVNVVPSKELIIASPVPCIVARGRKGGSNVAAAICNALLYMLGR